MHERSDNSADCEDSIAQHPHFYGLRSQMDTEEVAQFTLHAMPGHESSIYT